MQSISLLLFVVLQIQPINLDSISQKVTHAKTEKERIEQMMVLGAALPQIYSDSLLRMAETMKDVQGVDASYADAARTFLMGVHFYRQGRYQDCIQNMEQVIPVFRKLQEYKPLAKSYNWVSISYMRMREAPKALAVYEEVLQDKKLMEDRELLAVMYGNMAMLYRQVGDYEKAFHYFSLDLSLSPDDPHKLMVTYLNIASIFGQLDMYDEALTTLLSLDTAKLPDGPVKLAIFKDIGGYYEQLENANQASAWMHESLKSGRLIREYHQLIRPLVYLIKYYVQQSDWQQAQAYLKEAYTYAFQYGRGQEQIAYFGAAQLYYLSKVELDSSIYSGKQQIELVNKFRVPHMLSDTYTYLARAYEAKAMLDSANYFLNEQSVWERQNRQLNQQRLKADAEVKLRLREMNQQMLEVKNKVESIKYFRLGVILLSLLALWLLWRYIKYRKESKAAEAVNAFFQTLSTTQSERIKELESHVNAYKKAKNDIPELVVLRSKLQLHLNNLIYGRSEGHYILFYLTDSAEPIRERMTMKEVIQELPQSYFKQIHKSYFVNITHVREVSSTHVRTTTNDYLPVSRSYKPRLSEVFHK